MKLKDILIREVQESLIFRLFIYISIFNALMEFIFRVINYYIH